MKKVLIILSFLLILTGCGKDKNTDSLYCTYENTNEGANFTTNINVSLKDNNVEDATAVMIFNDEELAKTMCDILKKTDDYKGNLKCESKKITIKNYHKSVTSKIITKKDFLNYMKQQVVQK